VNRTAVRNIAIIAVLALGVTFLPRGGDIAEAVFVMIGMAFLAAITYAVYVASRQNQLTLLALPDSRRFVLYSSLGLIVLLVAGQSKMFASGLGTFAWLALLGSALVGIWLVWSEARAS
jgi:Mn2+/Fe2+ NRAMP family transporter